MAQHTINLPCNADTYVSEANPNTNYGSSNILRFGEESGKHLCALLKFNWSSLPAYKRIVGLTLKLYSTAAVTVGSWLFLSYQILSQPWNEHEVVYNHRNWPTGGYVGWQNQNIPANAYFNINISLSVANENIRDNGLCLNLGADGAKVCNVHSKENSNPPILTVVYEDVPPEKPILISPIGLYKENTNVIRFEWQYMSSVGGEQKKYDLQWSIDGQTWTTVSQTTPNNYYEMPANTLPAGNIYWRVRTYNVYDEVGEYSDPAVFYSMGEPEMPGIVSVSNSARPEINWVSREQQVYQIQILKDADVVYDTGNIPSLTVRTHKVKTFLDDGEYIAKLRIMNEYSMWSEWIEYPFNISTSKPPKPKITVQRSKYGLEINSSSPGYLYRDGICIAKIEKQYFDNTVVNGQEYQYFIRVVNGEAFSDSDIALGKPNIPFAVLSQGNNIVELRYGLNTVPGKNLSRTPVGTEVYYDDRKYPVYNMSEHTQSSITLSYFIKKTEDLLKIIKIVDKKETVLYRDKKGKKIYGIIISINTQDVRQGYIVTLIISQTDYNEEVQPDD